MAYTCNLRVMRKLTIMVSDEVYAGLYEKVGRRRISRFIEMLIRPHVVDEALQAAYLEMAADERQEAEALEWADAVLGDIADEPG